jgi:hypothetical protein
MGHRKIEEKRMNWEVGTYFKVIEEKSVYFGWIGRYAYDVAGQMMIWFDNGEGCAYFEYQLQWVA